MKGLLIKDLRLIKSQKTFLLTVCGFAILFSVMNKYSTFAMPYITMMIAMFAVGTIGYDEHNHGGAYLFALPVSRRGYVLEKYIYCLFMGGVALAGSVVFSCVSAVAHGEAIQDGELGLTILATFAATVVMYAWMIPIQLKFSAEKSRIALIGSIFAVYICIYGIVSVSEKLGIKMDIDGFLEMVMRQKVVVLAGTACIAGIVMILISYGISLKIVERKEF